MNSDDWLEAQLHRLKNYKDTNDPVFQRRKQQERMLLEVREHVFEYYFYYYLLFHFEFTNFAQTLKRQGHHYRVYWWQVSFL